MTTVQEDIKDLIKRMQIAESNTGNISFAAYIEDLKEIHNKIQRGLGVE